MCGYRKGYNTQYALLLLLEKWKRILDKQGYAGAILMDLSKAFGTINHDLLLAKLHVYGFHKKSLLLIKNYLSNRWHRTRINMSFSSWEELLSGVPQGSVSVAEVKHRPLRIVRGWGTEVVRLNSTRVRVDHMASDH